MFQSKKRGLYMLLPFVFASTAGETATRSCNARGWNGAAACVGKAARQAAARSRVLFIGYFGVVPFIRFIVMTCWRTVSCLRSRLRSADGALVWHCGTRLSLMDLTLKASSTTMTSSGHAHHELRSTVWLPDPSPAHRLESPGVFPPGSAD